MTDAIKAGEPKSAGPGRGYRRSHAYKLLTTERRPLAGTAEKHSVWVFEGSISVELQMARAALFGAVVRER